jgi:hypothetical protein
MRHPISRCPHIVAQLYGVPHGILPVLIIILDENEFSKSSIFFSQVSLSPEHFTLSSQKLTNKSKNLLDGAEEAHGHIVGQQFSTTRYFSYSQLSSIQKMPFVGKISGF